jgi:hypothetical protein
MLMPDCLYLYLWACWGDWGEFNLWVLPWAVVVGRCVTQCTLMLESRLSFCIDPSGSTARVVVLLTV